MRVGFQEQTSCTEQRTGRQTDSKLNDTQHRLSHKSMRFLAWHTSTRGSRFLRVRLLTAFASLRIFAAQRSSSEVLSRVEQKLRRGAHMLCCAFAEADCTSAAISDQLLAYRKAPRNAWKYISWLC